MGAGRKTGLLVLAGLAVAAVLAAPAKAAEFHLDCSAAESGDGSANNPFNGLAGTFTLGPGDRLLLRRGSSCSGQLKVTGGGSDTQPVEVATYGSGAKPAIVGTGTNAVLLEDTSNLTVRDLDISNPGSAGPLGEGSQIRNGIKAVAQAGSVRNLTLTGLSIHDVDGDLTKNPQGSAAIQASVTGPTPVRFENLRITGNEIRSVSRSGISITGTNDSSRPPADQPWPNASTGVVVEGNRIDLIAGDGIVPRGTDGAIVQANVVSRGNIAGRPLNDPGGPMCNAGIWTFRSNNTVIRGNEVFGMKFNGCDGTGFDVDYRQDGTVIEGNYSHHNEGGFMLLCTDNETHRADVRFNLSVDDAAMISHGPCGIADGVIGDLSGIRMFNNTVVGATPAVSMLLGPVSEMFEPGDFTFVNNLIYARQPFTAIPCGNNCAGNGFFNLPPSGSDPLTGNPLLEGPLLSSEGLGVAEGFRLAENSPLRGAGLAVVDPGEADYFGNPLPKKLSVGFDQSPGPEAPSTACMKARKARSDAWRKVRKMNSRLGKLRRRHAGPAEIRTARRKLRHARSAARRKARAARRACGPASASLAREEAGRPGAGSA